MKEMDIRNLSPRQVRCIDNKDHTWSHNDRASEFLKVGQIYFAESIDVHSWHTRVYLREFPGRWFNSVAFAETEGTE